VITLVLNFVIISIVIISIMERVVNDFTRIKTIWPGASD
jgi:hypothetical protein